MNVRARAAQRRHAPIRVDAWGQPIRLVDGNNRLDQSGVAGAGSGYVGVGFTPTSELRIWVWNSNNIQRGKGSLPSSLASILHMGNKLT